ncbi:carboxymuconolactone decarboxylase family protein [Oceanibacterium hippocampi]|uniref:Carboxymuconolactone decarboxylase family protein n=1 Tax=Oceanibacterium hippocampi TaxID=745714 RepID=A0A1Y5T5N4_9PROT|nr:carboxymuconolactone decarboxylase family protein [Oceanibacterium hippocampi]SLN56366.1 Carboxymuconolactone decarboxylase family protein [Oceanibacterium hippocampi]
MSVSYVEKEQADAQTKAFYGKAEERFQALLNIFKVFGHQPEYGTVFTDMIMAILKDGVLDWKTKELLILKATQRNECQYCVVQHERVSNMLGISDEKIADIDGDKYRTSPHYTEGEKALLDFAVQIGVDANRVSNELWERLHKHWSEPEIVDAAFVITIYIAVSKFGDALGVALEPMFDGVKPILHVKH